MFSNIKILICTSNRMALRAIWEKQPEVYFDVFQNRPNVSEGDLKNVGLFFPNCPQSHAITSTNKTYFNSKLGRDQFDLLFYVHDSKTNMGRSVGIIKIIISNSRDR